MAGMLVLGIESSCDETGVAVYDTALSGAAGLRAHAVYSQVALHAEYGGVVINKRSDKEGVRPVIFPHWFHRIRFRCKVCHYELGFKIVRTLPQHYADGEDGFFMSSAVA